MRTCDLCNKLRPLMPVTNRAWEGKAFLCVECETTQKAYWKNRNIRRAPISDKAIITARPDPGV